MSDEDDQDLMAALEDNNDNNDEDDTAVDAEIELLLLEPEPDPEPEHEMRHYIACRGNGHLFLRKMRAKLAAERHKRHASDEDIAKQHIPPDRAPVKKPELVQYQLHDMMFKETLPARDHCAEWDDFVAQLANVCNRTRYPIDDTLWRALIGRVCRSELASWLHALKLALLNYRHQRTAVLKRRSQVITTLDLLIKTLDDSTNCSSGVLQSLPKLVEIAASVLDQSCLNGATAFIVLNSVLKALDMWLPVFDVEQV